MALPREPCYASLDNIKLYIDPCARSAAEVAQGRDGGKRHEIGSEAAAACGRGRGQGRAAQQHGGSKPTRSRSGDGDSERIQEEARPAKRPQRRGSRGFEAYSGEAGHSSPRRKRYSELWLWTEAALENGSGRRRRLGSEQQAMAMTARSGFGKLRAGQSACTVTAKSCPLVDLQWRLMVT
ncbi:hypothetical protein TRIUR3_34559 [Triticum urartu]|uniref:Uncharacterized protein n=1 Tax=Triticum urartu TaxID=4572 RepID=M8AA10_TRIUA|nr:hypothetical protein TRIUR3_34559 [Triticum urartu]